MTTSSVPRTGWTIRPAGGLAALMALVVALSFGFMTTAGAEPTPTSTGTPTGAPDPTPEPDATTPAPSAPAPAPSAPAPSASAPTAPANGSPVPTAPAEDMPASSEPTTEDTEDTEDTENAETDEGSPRPDPTTGSSEPAASTGPPVDAGDDPSSSSSDVDVARAELLSAGRAGPFAAGITPNVVVSDGDNLLSLSIPGCAPVGGTATLDELVGFVDEEEVSQDESLDWRIEGPDAFVATGTVSFDEGFGEFTVSGLAQGDYTLVFSLEGGVQLEDEFRVIGCVTTTVSCAAISFTNPSTNPAVTVILESFAEDDEGTPYGDLTVAPGRTVTGYTGETSINWAAYWSDDVDFEEDDELPEGVFLFSSAGDDEDVAVPQDGCAASVADVSQVCSAADGSTLATVTITKLEPVTLYFEVYERSVRTPVAEGAIAPGGTTAAETVSLGAGGAYEFRLYVENAEEAYEVTELDVADCAPASTPTAPGDPTAEPTAAAAAPVFGGGAVLADTGASTGRWSLAGIGLLLAAGLAMIITGRRRQSA